MSTTFRDFLERTKTHIIYNNEQNYKELWLTYAQGSGSTIQLPDLKKYLNSDNTDKEHYDSDVLKIKDIVKSMKPLKSAKEKDSKLYEIPTYGEARGNNRYDIFGGDVKPNGKIYMIVTNEKSTIINFFEKKNEALNWIKTIS